jgi:transcriptional regulator with XRE-family HTH domain
VPRRTLYGCLRGEHEPRRQTLEKIAEFFEIPVEWFYEPYEDGTTKGGER